MIKFLGVGLVVMTILLVIAGNLLKNSYKENGALQGRVVGLEAEVQFQKDVGELNSRYNKELADVKDTARKQSDQRLSQMGLEGLSARSRSERNALEFGNDIHITIARIMCRIQSGTNTEAYSACNSAPPETFLGDVSLTITVNDESLKEWQSGCFTYRQHQEFTAEQHEQEPAGDHERKLGLKDLCAPLSITGFTPEGVSLILRYMEQLAAKSLEKSLHIDGLHKLIEKLQDPNFGVPK